MKITRNDQPKDFEPITLTITIENAEELKALWGRLNLNGNDINKHNTKNGSSWCCSYEELWDFWDMVDDLAIETGVKPK